MDEIAAIVDEDVVTRSEIDNRLKTIKAQAKNPAALPSDRILREQIVERLIIEKLQLQVARRAGVRVSDAELNDAMKRIAEQNQLTLESFRRALEQDGLSYNDMRQQVEQEIIIGRVQQGIMNSRIEISTDEIEDFLATDAGQELTADEYRIGHILIPIGSDPSRESIAQAKSEAEAVVAALQSGENFQSLAMEKSAGQNALEGGDLGWRKPNALPTLFADIAVDMKVEDIRGPIRSSSGFHVIKLLQRRGATAEGLINQTRVRHIMIKPNAIRSLEEA
ncbi:MAG: peptidylprolyl isomerase, partial [Pseudomonadales bacterium]